MSDEVTVEVDGGNYSNDTTLRIEAEDYTQMSGIQTQTTTDNNGDLNVGWIDVGDYMEYEINIPTAGVYSIAYRISSVDEQGAVNVQINGVDTISTSFASTEGWNNWVTKIDTITLPEGNITLRLVATGINWNLNWIDLTLN